MNNTKVIGIGIPNEDYEILRKLNKDENKEFIQQLKNTVKQLTEQYKTKLNK